MKTCSELRGSFVTWASNMGLRHFIHDPSSGWVKVIHGTFVHIKCFHKLEFRPTRELLPAVVVDSVGLRIVDDCAPS
jgi:hypothetical protein